ncbi:hypothetical protein TWF730_006026 [Orbilia blumenaviensis]|uniref:NADP-dependent oxidoreductase domain-containing protein n=1 Tax=Orbilia blumenaviensis TaxID=1796055 RepID=A0AAV9VMA3_9PEZI
MAPKYLTKDLVPLTGSSAKIPRIGYGVYRSVDCQTAVLAALSVGYRHIDTAQFYKNEADVGRAIKLSRIPRKELYIVTKIQYPVKDSVEETLESLKDSVQKLDSGEEGRPGYVDLFLIHTPSSGRQGREILWRALEMLKEGGGAVDIGVSNYGIEHLFQMDLYTSTTPVCNQIEVHPFCQQREVISFCRSKGIAITAYAPIVRNRRSDNPTLVTIGQKHGKQSTQIMIKWSLQKGFIPLPKSDNPDRMKANIDMDGWELTEEEMSEIDHLDEGQGGAICPYPLNCP